MKDKRIWIIFLIIFVNLLGFGIILPLLPYYVESFGAGAITFGFITATYSLFQIISAPILGELSDKYGRRPILLISVLGTAVSFGLLGIAQSIPMLFLARILDGATGGNISTAQAYIADITDKENRTQGMGIMMAAFSLGFILGPAIGGLLSVYGYALPAFVAGAVALLATILTYFFLPESLPTEQRKTKQFKLSSLKFFSTRDFIDALNHPAIGTLLTISFMTMLAFSLMQATFVLFTESTLQLTARTNGLIFTYVGFIGILVQLFLLKLATKLFPERIIIIAATLMMAGALGLIAISHTISLLMVAVTFIAIANGLANPVIAGQISKRSSKEEQGNIAGLNQSVGSIARLFGPLIGTFFYSQLSIRSPYYLAVGILLLTAVITIRQLKPATLPTK